MNTQDNDTESCKNFLGFVSTESKGVWKPSIKKKEECYLRVEEKVKGARKTHTVAYVTHSSTLKMEASNTYETSVNSARLHDVIS
jgi:hypothetical protein